MTMFRRPLTRPIARRRWPTLVAAAALAFGALSAPAVAATSARGATLYVSPAATGTSGSAGTSCADAGYRTIASALKRAVDGDTVVVCDGTYPEHVTVSRAVTLQGDGNAVIDATSFNVAVRITGDGATVTGLTITNATGQGIFATNVADITITDNVVEHNDLGVGGKSTYLYCTTKNFVPDCGEGVHLSGVSDSRVEGNTIRDNSGGILVSDELGPTHDNVITREHRRRQRPQLRHHHRRPPEGRGRRQRHAAPEGRRRLRQHDHEQRGDQQRDHGHRRRDPAREPKAGMAAYRNTFSGNTVSQNGLAGITINENTVGQYLDGNVITANVVGTNNLLQSATAGNGATTGISVYVADGARDVLVTVRDNTISANAYGIYAMKGTVLTQSGNTFTDVTTPVYVGT